MVLLPVPPPTTHVPCVLSPSRFLFHGYLRRRSIYLSTFNRIKKWSEGGGGRTVVVSHTSLRSRHALMGLTASRQTEPRFNYSVHSTFVRVDTKGQHARIVVLSSFLFHHLCPIECCFSFNIAVEVRSEVRADMALHRWDGLQGVCDTREQALHFLLPRKNGVLSV